MMAVTPHDDRFVSKWICLLPPISRCGPRVEAVTLDVVGAVDSEIFGDLSATIILCDATERMNPMNNSDALVCKTNLNLF
jgi:hypothetical protein